MEFIFYFIKNLLNFCSLSIFNNFCYKYAQLNKNLFYIYYNLDCKYNKYDELILCAESSYLFLSNFLKESFFFINNLFYINYYKRYFYDISMMKPVDSLILFFSFIIFFIIIIFIILLITKSSLISIKKFITYYSKKIIKYDIIIFFFEEISYMIFIIFDHFYSFLFFYSSYPNENLEIFLFLYKNNFLWLLFFCNYIFYKFVFIFFFVEGTVLIKRPVFIRPHFYIKRYVFTKKHICNIYVVLKCLSCIFFFFYLIILFY